MSKVRTRFAPSPTGRMHVGNLRTALYAYLIAKHEGGDFLLRIEDTDQERYVEGAVDIIYHTLAETGLIHDEGPDKDGGCGPYVQSERQAAGIYMKYAKELVEKGKAYYCFCDKERLESLKQEVAGKEIIVYDKHCLHLSKEEVEANLAAGKPFVIRQNTPTEGTTRFVDEIYGVIEVPNAELDDMILIKSDGYPTYNFANVVDDHLMGTTVVVRGEEWLATLPVHLQLFRAMGWKAPKYAHTAQLMKIDPETGGKRKLSKRKDPELALTFYAQEGYPVPAVLEYLMTLLNSNFEEWRRANPDLPMNDFQFTTKKMSGSGALFDIEKLRDVSKNVISRMTAEQVYDFVAEWSAVNDKEFNALLTRDPAFSKAYLAIGRGGKKPRKDLALWSDAKGYMDFMFDELFQPDYTMPERVSAEDAKAILSDFAGMFDENDTPDAFFDKMKQIASAHGYAADTKAYKADPSAYKGAVGDVSMVVRVAVAGRQNAPDLQTVMGILGKEKVLERLDKCAKTL